MGMLISANLSLVMTLTEPAIASSFFALMVTVYTAGQVTGASLTLICSSFIVLSRFSRYRYLLSVEHARLVIALGV